VAQVAVFFSETDTKHVNTVWAKCTVVES